MKIAGVVILYFPDESVVANIQTYLPVLDKLYIFDNSDKPKKAALPPKILEDPKVAYIADGENHGIAESLNVICRKAIDDGYRWLLTMDQDSSFEKDQLENYLKQFALFPHPETVSMFGVEHYRPNTFHHTPEGYRDMRQLITSGSLVNLQHFETIGGFDEQLFIDEVDCEYCFHSILKGYRIVLFETILLNHAIGVTRTFRSLKNLAKTPRSLHSPVRVYYMVRNHLYMYRKYKQHFLADLRFSRSAILQRLKNNLLYNEQRGKVFKFILKAVADYRKGNMGKVK